MKRFLLAAALLLLAGSQAFAQSSVLAMARAVTACGGQTFTAGKNYPVTIDLTGTLCSSTSGGGVATAVNVAQINGVTPLMGNGVTGTGSPRVTIASDNTAFPVNAQPTPVTSGGLSTYFLQPTASDNHANIKNGAGQVYKITATCAGTSCTAVNWLRLYNAASGFNGCNSATNLVYQMAIPASTTGAGFVDSWELGMAFSTGISICVTSGYATTDTTAATASVMSINIGYK